MDRAEQIGMIRRHIAVGERHVASQRAIVRRFIELGANTRLAEDILEEFEATLAEHRHHLAQVMDRKE
jgi:hypothetical protein